MSETKTYVFGNDANNSILSCLAPLLQKQGLDPNMIMAMMNNRNGFGSEGGWFMWVIFLFFLMGWGGNGFNGFGNRGNAVDDAALRNLINNNDGRELLMQAIQGNNTAINQLANTLNCSIGQIQQAIDCLEEIKSKNHSREERNYDDEDYRYRNERNGGGRYSRY